MSYFGVSTRNGVGLGLGTVPSLTNTPLGYRLAPSLDLSFAGSDALSPAITFSRTTNATLTNSAGLIANAPMNLLTFSEQFDNAAWTKSNTTITANTTVAPNGTTTADKLVENTANNTHYVASTIATVTAGAPLTASVYAKLDLGRNIEVRLTSNNGSFTFSYIVVSLVDGSTVSTAGNATSKVNTVTPVGNGWYRISVTATLASDVTMAAVWCGLWNGTAPSYIGDGSSGVFTWGAQLELGSTATTYNPTTVKNLLGFTEHFDNAAWTKSNAFVQTNLLTYSQEFTNSAWVKDANRGSFATNAVSPIGDATAQTLTSGTDGYGYAFRTVAATVGVAYAYSIYAKAGTSNFAYIEMSGFGISYVNLTTLAISAAAGVTVTATSVGSGWVRIVGVATASATSHVIAFGGANASGSQVMTSGNTVLFWGAQLVQGTTPGDYKATYAAAAAVGYTDIYGQPFAQKLVENTATSIHSLIQPITPTTSTLYTGTLYVKAAERAFAFVGIGQTGNNSFASINLSTGAVSVAFGSPTVSATSIGNGWFRVSVTVASISTASLSLEARVSTDGVWDNRSYTGDGTSGIYIFGAQLSDSASVDPYVYQPVAAPTSTAYYGPRFDYDPVTLAPKGLLIEEQRTNLLLRSDDFANASWTKTNATIAANSAVAPDGSISADILIEAATTSAHYVDQSVTTSAVPYTFSVYAKAVTRSWVYLRIADSSGIARVVWFNAASGVIGTVGGGITASIGPVGNGWYKCVATISAAFAGNQNPRIGVANADNVESYAGDGTSGILIYGAQAEAGSFATSYIPTVASQVTRAADSASMIGNNFARWYNVNEGTLFADYNNQITLTSVNYGVATIKDSGADNAIGMLSGLSSGFTNFVSRTSGVIQASLATSSNSPVNNKLAGAYAVNNFGAAVNGVDLGTDTSGTLPVVDRMLIGANRLTNPAGQITLKRIAYYNRRLANSELIGITS